MQSRIELSAAPGQLRCEQRPQPLGVGTALPGFSWQSMDTRSAEIESAWQILVASERSLLVPATADPVGDLWDSGVVAGSSRGLMVSYGGTPLVSRQRVWWTVRSFDSDGFSSGFAEPACFEVGLLSNADWRGEWLSVPWQGSATDGGPVAALLRDFTVAELPVEARLYIAVLGRAVVQLNGRAVDAAVGDVDAGDPGQRQRYRTLDVTRHLLPGTNRLGVLLGDGTSCGNYLLPAARESFATAPELLVQLEWRDADGGLHRVVSDDRWLLYRSSIVESDPVLGEALDLRRWNPNWSVPTVPIDWEAAVPRTRALRSVPLVADPFYDVDRPPRPTSELLTLDTLEYLLPESRTALPRPRLNGLLIDLGAVREGRLRVDGRFADGDRLLVHYARARSELSAALDSDRFTSAAGDGELEAQLAERPFRFARLAGTVEWRDVEAIRFSSTLSSPGGPRLRETTELLECDQPVLAAAITRASDELKAALASRPAFPVSTVQGQSLRPISWLEPLAGCATVLALFGEPAGVRRWIEDARDALQKFGYLPRALPAPTADPLLAPEGRSDLFVQMLWVAYSGFGDQATLRAAMPELELLVARWQSKTRDRFFSDPSWNEERRLPADYVGGTRLGVALTLAAELAEQVDAVRAAGRFRRYAAELKSGFRARYLTGEGQLLFRSLDACLLALAAEYLDDREAEAAVADLVRALTPVVRTGAALPVMPELYATLFRQLFAHDQADLAYQLLSVLCARLEEGGPKEAGNPPIAVLTTDDADPLHWLPWGQLLEVCFGSILGIQLSIPALDHRPAFRDCHWLPQPPRPQFAAAGAGAAPTRIKALLRTASGPMTFGWHLDAGKLYCISILPADLKVQLQLPNGQTLRQVAGEHEFAVDLTAEEDGIPVLLDAIRGALPRVETAHS